MSNQFKAKLEFRLLSFIYLKSQMDILNVTSKPNQKETMVSGKTKRIHPEIIVAE